MTDQTTNAPQSLADIAATIIQPIEEEKKTVPSSDGTDQSTDTGPGGEASADASDDADSLLPAAAADRDGDGAGEDDKIEVGDGAALSADGDEGEELVESPSPDETTKLEDQAVEDDDPYAVFDEPKTQGDDQQSVAQTDESLISVNVDGQMQEIALGELKRRYSGEGAIEKRLQEATELRNTSMQAAQKNREQWTQLYQALSSELFKTSIPKPDPSLAGTDPVRYQTMLQLHEDEVKSNQQKVGSVRQALEQMKKEEAETADTTRTSEAAKLREVLPILTHPTRGAVIQRAIVENAIGIYGFSQKDLSDALDHRLFYMAHDAMMWQMQKGKTEVRKVKGVERTIRPAASAKAKPTRKQSQNAQRMAKAHKTGAMDDIAASLIVPKSNRRLSARTT